MIILTQLINTVFTHFKNYKKCMIGLGIEQSLLFGQFKARSLNLICSV